MNEHELVLNRLYLTALDVPCLSNFLQNKKDITEHYHNMLEAWLIQHDIY